MPAPCLPLGVTQIFLSLTRDHSCCWQSTDVGLSLPSHLNQCASGCRPAPLLCHLLAAGHLCEQVRQVLVPFL